MWETPDSDCVCKATGRGGVGRHQLILKPANSGAAMPAQSLMFDHPSGLILQPLLKFAIPIKICYHSSTANSEQADHFKPNFC